MPRYAVLLHSTEHFEASDNPHPGVMEAIVSYTEMLVKAGVATGAEGFTSTSKGAKVQSSPGGVRSVQNGPFTDVKTEDLISGFWIFETKDLDEAIDWVKKSPDFPHPVTFQIRKIATHDDFGEGLTDEVRAKEAVLRAGFAAKSA